MELWLRLANCEDFLFKGWMVITGDWVLWLLKVLHSPFPCESLPVQSCKKVRGVRLSFFLMLLIWVKISVCFSLLFMLFLCLWEENHNCSLEIFWCLKLSLKFISSSIFQLPCTKFLTFFSSYTTLSVLPRCAILSHKYPRIYMFVRLQLFFLHYLELFLLHMQ